MWAHLAIKVNFAMIMIENGHENGEKDCKDSVVYGDMAFVRRAKQNYVRGFLVVIPAVPAWNKASSRLQQ